MMKLRTTITILILTAVVCVAALTTTCKKKEDETVPVATVTAVDTTPTGGTVATATIALTPPDTQFCIDAGTALLAEIAFARTADSGAKNVSVKALAHLLVEDMIRLNNELKAYAAKHNVVLPTVTDTATDALNAHLATLKGKNFDQTFLKQVIDDHTAMIKLFNAEAQVVSDKDLKKWVADTTPVLQSHLDKATALQTKIGKEKY
jgi:putative membrane protein